MRTDMKGMMNSLMAVTFYMAAPQQLLATQEVVSDDRGIPEISRNKVPPPPPGPYMSMALEEAPAFKRQREIPHGDAGHSPFFKADMPWPETRRAPQQWMPDDGYQYAPPSAYEQRMPPRDRPESHYQYGYQQPAWQPLPPPGARPQWDRPAAPEYRGRQDYQQRPDDRRYAPPRYPESPWLPLGDNRGW